MQVLLNFLKVLFVKIFITLLFFHRMCDLLCFETINTYKNYELRIMNYENT